MAAGAGSFSSIATVIEQYGTRMELHEHTVKTLHLKDNSITRLSKIRTLNNIYCISGKRKAVLKKKMSPICVSVCVCL